MSDSRDKLRVVPPEVEEIARARLEAKDFAPAEDLSPSSPTKLLEELRIHQIELEMQHAELMRANEALTQSRDWYFALFEAAPMPFFLVSEQRIVKDCNLIASDSLGWTRDAIIGHPLLKHFKAHEHLRVHKMLGETFRSGKELLSEVEMRSKTGEILVMDVRTHRLHTADDPILALGLSDQTDRKRSRLALEAALTQAENASQAKTQFLANVSHELRTPLTAVLGYLDLVLTNRRPTQNQSMLTVARRAASLLQGTVSDLLDLARVESNQLEIQSQAFSMTTLMMEIKAQFQEQAQLKGLDLKVRVLDHVPDFLLGDPHRIRQIMNNLISNALKCTVDGEVSIKAAYRQGNIVLTVEDTGIGIPADKLSEVFRPFEQVEDGDSRPIQGTGLGLALCKQLTELMGGALFVRSTPGEGSAFTVQLPMPVVDLSLMPSSQDVIESEVQLTERERPSKRILIVDDDVPLSQLFAICVEDGGHKADVVHSGAEAIEKARECRYDIILMDIQMPGMDGFQTLEAISAEGLKQGAFVIAVTARATKGYDQHCLSAGFDGYIPKPINAASFVREIETLSS